MAARRSAVSISATLTDLQTGTARGAVLAAFEHSAYLHAAGRVVALTAGLSGRGPLAIVLENDDGLAALAADDPVEIAAGTLRAGSLTVGLDRAESWDAALPAIASGDGAHGLQTVTDELLSHAPPGSIAALLGGPWSTDDPRHGLLLSKLERGLRVIGAFLSGAAGGDEASRAVQTDIAGLGPGLTPSGDDLLTGIMHALTLWPRLASHAGGLGARTAIAEAARDRTTRISAAYLEAAGAGLGTDPWHTFVRSLIQPAGVLRAAVRGMLAVGETSGADALTGFCWAWRRLSA